MRKNYQTNTKPKTQTLVKNSIASKYKAIKGGGLSTIKLNKSNKASQNSELKLKFTFMADNKVLRDCYSTKQKENTNPNNPCLDFFSNFIDTTSLLTQTSLPSTKTTSLCSKNLPVLKFVFPHFSTCINSIQSRLSHQHKSDFFNTLISISNHSKANEVLSINHHRNLQLKLASKILK